MSHKGAIEALDRTLRDLRNSEKVMGGVTVVFSGDFFQTLPVILKGTVCSEKISPALDHPNEMPTYRIFIPLFSDRLTT